MTNFILLFVSRIVVFVFLKLTFSRFIDNGTEIDLAEEQKLTERKL